MAKSVLIVEDNELNMKLFHDLLEAHGYNTLQTRTGIEALRLAREHRPDLILMDDGMQHLALARGLHLQGQIACTLHAGLLADQD
uniref:response regulator n=1 Tax=Roseibium sp. TaxID=1936156 RepID=UPI003D0C0E94